MMATFWVGQAGELKRNLKIDSVQLGQFTLAKAYFAFRFYDKSRVALVTADMQDQHGTTDIIWAITPGFFTPERMGPCETQIVILDSDNNPTITFPIQKDEVVGMIMSPAELTA